MSAYSDEVYFGGIGDPTHWVGYQLALKTDNSIDWIAYTLDAAKKRGKIKIAPATFNLIEANRWSAIFDEYIISQSSITAGLSKHDIRIISIKEGKSVQIQDGDKIIELLKVSQEDMKQIKNGQIPNKKDSSIPSSPDR